jgi:LacI family transcriptional regulator, galactose operon repressor
VARQAGVSVGTVSNVLNQRANVRIERAARVHDAIAALRYVPNGVAQSLRRQRSRVVGLCAPLTSSAYFAALLDAFEDIASAQGYEVMQVLSRQDSALEERRVRALIARKVDGLIVIPSASPQRTFDLIVESGVPAVIVDRLSDDSRFDYVTLDDYGAMEAATRALLERGHRCLLYVVGNPKLVTTRRRIEAFRATARRARGAVAEVCVREPDDTAFARQIGTILQRNDPPTAAIGSNSALTLALLKVLRQHGIAIPRDLSLIAFDAPDWSDVLAPPLAVIRPPTRDIARTAWELLLRRMDAPGVATEHVELSASLELAGSVASIAR